jgi:hypothetical protein
LELRKRFGGLAGLQEEEERQESGCEAADHSLSVD